MMKEDNTGVWPNEETDMNGGGGIIITNEHTTNGSPCWCNPRVIYVPFNESNPIN